MSKSLLRKKKRADREAVKKLEAVYAKLPKLACQGKCQECCGPIGLTPVEHDRMKERGQPLPMLAQFHDGALFSKQMRCPQLAPNGRCTIYSIRPMVCRLWGIVESMKCPHGCVPEGGFLPDDEGHLLFREAMEAGGVDVPSEEHMKERLAMPEMQRDMKRIMARGAATDRRRMGLSQD